MYIVLLVSLKKNIKKFPVWMDNHRLFAKIQDICFSAKEVCYHSISRVKYENNAKATPLPKEDLTLKKNNNGEDLTLKKNNNGEETKEQPYLW